LKKRLPRKFFLYIIVDKAACGKRGVFNIADKIRSTNTVIQFRDKFSDRIAVLNDALRLKDICRKNKLVFIINDYLDIAKMVDADGLHLGQDDLPIGFARQVLGPKKIIGVSCHSLGQAKQAQRSGADYIAIGPVFKTPTKPDYQPVGLNTLKKVVKNAQVPVCAIGGINQENIKTVRAYGPNAVCLVRAICQAKDINRALKELKQ